MEPEAVLNLIDSSWFYLRILEIQPKTSDNSPSSQEQASPVRGNENLRVETKLSIHNRSRSDQLCYADVITSPDSVLSSNNKAHLETILSQKEYSADNYYQAPKTPQSIRPSTSRKSSSKIRRRKGLSKSMSQLEYEELKGFVDLGFVFSEEDKEDSGLVDMIPGLQRLGHEETGKHELEFIDSGLMRSRPYLSEAWDDIEKEREEEERLLMSWRVPVVSNEVDIKENLKWWAHTVASAVR